MATTKRILCVHGLGDHRRSAWEAEWSEAVLAALGPSPNVRLEFRFLTYDPIFEKTNISFGETLGAFWKLARSGVGGVFRRSRGPISEISDRLRWTAGYVVAWVEDDRFQAETRKLVLDAVSEFKPDVILAHSLGSLVTYNAFSHSEAAQPAVTKALSKAHYVTFGSQIGNPFVLGNLTNGRVRQLNVAHWHHLYNEHDDVFTAPLPVQGVSNFNQLLTSFDLPGRGDHAPSGYITHNTTQTSFWGPFVDQAGSRGTRQARGLDPWDRSVAPSIRQKRRRALLIGIDDYPQESQRLYGCVNDVFSMSATLQDCGFEPEEIRTCLNDRATAKGIMSRLEWLVDDVRAGDEIVFYYSGHGARLPEYGLNDEPDRETETLVPYDFDWSPETSVSDEQIYQLYSQLPYELSFLMIFDCCHSGGIHRQSAARARGIAPPDDIRHRQLRWDREEQMWVEREFEEINSEFSRKLADRREFFGENLSTVRIGRAAALRIADERTYNKAKRDVEGPVGPYLPLIIQACGEDQLSYEYRHGATSYGAFTFCLTSILRQEKGVTFDQLVKLSRERLTRLGYQQTPQILGPRSHMTAKVPFETGRGKTQPAGNLPGSQTPRTSG